MFVGIVLIVGIGHYIYFGVYDFEQQNLNYGYIVWGVILGVMACVVVWICYVRNE